MNFCAAISHSDIKKSHDIRTLGNYLPGYEDM